MKKEEKSHALFYMICSLILLMTMIWAIWDEVFTDRVWKDYQKKFNSLVVDKAEKELEEEKAKFESSAVQKEYQGIKSKLENARKEFKKSGSQSEYGRLQAAMRNISKKELVPIQLKLTDVRNRVLEAEYLKTKYQTEEYENKLEKLKEESKQVLATAKEIKARLAEMQEKKVALTEVIEKCEKELIPFTSPINKLGEKLASLKKKRPSLQDCQLNVPGLNRVDRCESCHAGIDKSESYSDEEPFKKHPGSYIFLKNHPLKDFGCTVCHEGQGRATTSAEKAHGNVHHWLHPMLKGGLSQASCMKCHEKVEDLPGASLVAEGLRLFSKERGCIGCHDVEGVPTVKIGPPLTYVGEKVSYKWLSAWLKDPHVWSEMARMPNFMLSNEEIENIADFLVGLSRETRELMIAANPDVDEEMYQRGMSIYNRSRCVICHLKEGKGGTIKYVYAPEHTKIASKMSKDWLVRWMKNPQEYHPETKMPHFKFTDNEIEDLVAYISAEFIDWDALEEEEEGVETVEEHKIDPASAEKGRKLIKSYGCFGCHKIKGFEKEGKMGVELTAFGSKGVNFLDFGVVHDLDKNWLSWIVAKLKEPRQFREGLLMPKFSFTDEEFESLVCLLASFTEEKIPIDYFVKASKEEYEPQGEFGKIVRDLNCLVCHSIKGNGGSFAPNLTYEGSRVKGEWIKDFLNAPDILRPLLKQMPRLNLLEEEIEVIADYMKLVLLDDEIHARGDFDEIASGDVEKGKEIYNEKGCQVCHQIGPEGGAVGPNLSVAGDRLTKDYIYMHLENPQKWGESKVAPDYDLTDEELTYLTKYLSDLRAKKVSFLWKNTD